MTARVCGRSKGIGVVEGIASADEMEKAKEMYCSLCNTIGIKSKSGRWYCPNEYKSHKGQKGKMMEKTWDEKLDEIKGEEEKQRKEFTDGSSITYDR